MPSTPISTLTLPDGNTYDFKDSNAIYEIPMAGNSTLGGVKIPVSGNITIDANGYIDATSSSSTTWYGTCNTDASTAAKLVTCSGFTLSTGTIIGIYFSTGNTVNTPTLNINSTGAKSIFVGSASASSTNVLKWSAYTMLYFMYDGTQYRYITSISNQTVVPSRGANTWYGISSTTASTTAKTSTIDNFVLTKGALVSVTFTYDNTANAPTLNINSTGAKSIYYNNAITSSSNKLTWGAGETVTFIYSGAYYYFICKTAVAVDISGKLDKDVTVSTSRSLISNEGSEASIEVSNSSSESFSESIFSSDHIGLYTETAEIGSGILIEDDGISISSGGSNGVKIYNVVTPTNNTDAANKAYVDGLVSALTNTEIDNAVAAAVTVNNANTTSY